MKKIVKTAMFIWGMVGASNAFASITECVCPYVGADYRQVWIKGRNFWDDRVAKSFPGGTLYIGAKFTENFGMEAGYNWTVHKHKSSTVLFANPGVVTAPGVLAPNFGIIKTRARFNSFYIDLNGYVPLDNCWELIGTLGLGSMKPKLGVTIVNRGTLTPLQFSALQVTGGGAKAVWRVGVGAQYLFTQNIGIRGLVRYEGTDGLRVRRNFNTFGISDKAYKDAVSASLGVFVRF